MAGFNSITGPTFTQILQYVNGRAPASNSGWSIETALDVEWAHAIAPKANVLLVEANTSSISNMLSSVQYAAQQPGVVAVSMSWGSSEFSTESSNDSVFTTPVGHIGGSGLPGSVAFVASSGDTGGQAIWPSVSPNVLSVGGTSLTLNSNNTYSSETGWSGSGGGNSQFEKEPAFQQGVQTSGKRSTPDVSLNADPNTGVYVYSAGSWYEVGGTSASAPQWAALIAIADQQRAATLQGSLGTAQVETALYQLGAKNTNGDFHDVTSGTAGSNSAHAGYDQVTGLGSPAANVLIPDLVKSTSPTTPTATIVVSVSSSGSVGGAAGGQQSDKDHAPQSLDSKGVFTLVALQVFIPFSSASTASGTISAPNGQAIAMDPNSSSTGGGIANASQASPAASSPLKAEYVPFVKRGVVLNVGRKVPAGPGQKDGGQKDGKGSNPVVPDNPPPSDEKSPDKNKSKPESTPDDPERPIPTPEETTATTGRLVKSTDTWIQSVDGCFVDFRGTEAVLNGGEIAPVALPHEDPFTLHSLLKQSAVLVGGLAIVLGRTWRSRTSKTTADAATRSRWM